MIHLPLLRAGRPYRSLQVQTLRDVRDGSAVAEVSQAIPGVLAHDLGRIAEARKALRGMSTGELVQRCQKAAELFAESDLPLGAGDAEGAANQPMQSVEDYVDQLAATTGMPKVMGRNNMGKIVAVLENMGSVLGGLTRGLDLEVLDRGWGEQEGRKLSYQAQTDSLGLVLPNNSPGVHTLWLPAIPLQIPLVIKPGSAEPWTPWRIIQAFIAAGVPREAFSFYPAGHGAVPELLLRTGRSLFFGDASTVRAWKGERKVQLHGPGWSKLLLGPEAAERFEDHLELIAGSVAANGGRSCINASGVWTAARGRELAEALAQQLAKIEARPLDHPEAALAAFPDPEVAKRISNLIDEQLHDGGAVDLCAQYREGSRVATAGGCTFLLPTVIWSPDPQHSLAHSEFGFPFVSVVEAPLESMPEAIGPTLVGSVLDQDPEVRATFLSCRHIDRLNLGPVPTYQMSWDQPHEGNLFDHLYQQRAFQLGTAAA